MAVDSSPVPQEETRRSACRRASVSGGRRRRSSEAQPGTSFHSRRGPAAPRVHRMECVAWPQRNQRLNSLSTTSTYPNQPTATKQKRRQRQRRRRLRRRRVRLHRWANIYSLLTLTFIKHSHQPDAEHRIDLLQPTSIQKA